MIFDCSFFKKEVPGSEHGCEVSLAGSFVILTFCLLNFKGTPDLKMFSKPIVLGALARYVLSAYVGMVSVGS